MKKRIVKTDKNKKITEMVELMDAWSESMGIPPNRFKEILIGPSIPIIPEIPNYFADWKKSYYPVNPNPIVNPVANPYTEAASSKASGKNAAYSHESATQYNFIPKYFVDQIS